MTEPLYQTKMVSAATGASERQLQWWDETKVLPVPIVDNKRWYRFRDALAARLIMQLGGKHITLRQSGEILAELSNGGGDLIRVADSDCHILLVNTSGAAGMQLVSRAAVLYRLLDSEEPVVAVDLRYEAAELAKALG